VLGCHGFGLPTPCASPPAPGHGVGVPNPWHPSSGFVRGKPIRRAVGSFGETASAGIWVRSGKPHRPGFHPFPRAFAHVTPNSYLNSRTMFPLVPMLRVGMPSATLRVGQARQECGRRASRTAFPRRTVGTSRTRARGSVGSFGENPAHGAVGSFGEIRHAGCWVRSGKNRRRRPRRCGRSRTSNGDPEDVLSKSRWRGGPLSIIVRGRSALPGIRGTAVKTSGPCTIDQA
jgi:hypothetical protein